MSTAKEAKEKVEWEDLKFHIVRALNATICSDVSCYDITRGFRVSVERDSLCIRVERSYGDFPIKDAKKMNEFKRFIHDVSLGKLKVAIVSDKVISISCKYEIED